MKINDGSLCSLGPDDIFPQEDFKQSFASLEIGDLETKELKWFEFNQDDYNNPRIEAGYICEKEGER